MGQVRRMGGLNINQIVELGALLIAVGALTRKRPDGASRPRDSAASTSRNSERIDLARS